MKRKTIDIITLGCSKKFSGLGAFDAPAGGSGLSCDA